jgi:beta-N-acetylhexosaminidase
MALGATFSEDLVARAAAATAGELRAMGINVNLGPVVDVNSNPLNPVIGTRSFGADPAWVARLGAAAVEATQRSGVLAVAKHFPGHGDADADSHLGLPLLPHTAERFAAVEWPPFEAAVAAGASGVMTAHLAVPALEPDPLLPASLSPRIVGALRQLVGDDRLIISDDLEMGAILEGLGTAEAAKMALLAGSDVLLFRRNADEQRRAHALLAAAVQTGEIPLPRLDASVRRVLRAKQAAGLLGDQPPFPALPQALPVAAGSPANQAVAAEAARRAVTLVRNEGGALPLSISAAAGQRLCVVFPRPAEVAWWEVIPAPPAGPATYCLSGLDRSGNEGPVSEPFVTR